jgi:large subunit ribosomal protein L24e
MAASKEKLRAHRTKLRASKTDVSTALVEPISANPEMVREKIKVHATKSALIPGEGRSMGMEID